MSDFQSVPAIQILHDRQRSQCVSESLNRRRIWLECCVRLSTKWSILATSSRDRTTTIRILLCPWLVRLLAAEVDRGVAICGSGVGACIAANKVPGVRACLIHESFSARQGVEDDDIRVICLGGRVVANTFAWELVRTFLEARFSGAERHRRRLAKVAGLDRRGDKNMKNNPLKQLRTLGQSIWLDYIRRDLIASGRLRRLIEEDGLRGMTSNPSIFEKAIAESHDYDEDIKAMALKGKNVQAIYENLSQRDVQSAADEFRPLYDMMDGEDGYVSLEVNPHLAHDTNGTIQEARRLWAALDRPNVLIKVPATASGLPAIQQLISEGINVNVTLLFGLPRYRQVAEAYIAGIESRAAQGKSIERVASVASFFVSRIDALVDPLLEKFNAETGKRVGLREKRHTGRLPSPARRWPTRSIKKCSAATGLGS